MRSSLRLFIGLLLLLPGIAFAFIPVIPLGYLFLIGGLFVLAPLFPPIARLLGWVEEKDPTGKVEATEEQVERRLRNLEKRTRPADEEKPGEKD